MKRSQKALVSRREKRRERRLQENWRVWLVMHTKRMMDIIEDPTPEDREREPILAWAHDYFLEVEP